MTPTDVKPSKYKGERHFPSSYRFERLTVREADDVTMVLNHLHTQGYTVVSHNECDGDYTFVLFKPETTEFVWED